MRKVFLDDLPHGGKFIPESKVNWKESIGYKVKFIYDHIEGEFEILDYDNKKYRLTVLYNGEKFNHFVGDIGYCRISSMIGLRLKKHKYDIGDVVSVKSGDIKIIKYTDIKNGNTGFVRGYTYECLNCKHQNNITEGHLKERLGCSVCMNQVVKKGINDMWTTNPELAKLLNNPEDGFKYMQNSNLKVDWKCLDCGNIIRNKQPSNIKNKGLSCPKCSDKISFPEKITYNILSQFNIEFETQKSFKWSDKKRYDFYIPNLKMIIEVHGLQHYEKSNRGRSLEEEQKNDRLKEKLAMENGIRYYIIIDARYSELEYIKDSFFKSIFSDFFDFSNIDWELCQSNASKSLIKISCDLWNSGLENTLTISKQLHISRNTVSKYLQKGAKLGWCDYSIEKVKSKQLLNLQQNNRRKVICLNTYEIFDSIKSATMKYPMSDSKISATCKGYQKTAGKHPETSEPLRWMYYNEYIYEQENLHILVD